jgi:hypothetical protein
MALWPYGNMAILMHQENGSGGKLILRIEFVTDTQTDPGVNIEVELTNKLG